MIPFSCCQLISCVNFSSILSVRIYHGTKRKTVINSMQMLCTNKISDVPCRTIFVPVAYSIPHKLQIFTVSLFRINCKLCVSMSSSITNCRMQTSIPSLRRRCKETFLPLICYVNNKIVKQSYKFVLRNTNHDFIWTIDEGSYIHTMTASAISRVECLYDWLNCWLFLFSLHYEIHNCTNLCFTVPNLFSNPFGRKLENESLSQWDSL
jgi:hypothetical protein